MRNLSRIHWLRPWEIEQAAELGWIEIETIQPPTGRPSRVARILNNHLSAKAPPWRNEIPSTLSIRHENFVIESCMPGPGFSVASATSAYLKSFPACKSRAAAAAGASRLLKRPMIRAARLWFRRTGLAYLDEPMPPTPEGIRKRLREMGL